MSQINDKAKTALFAYVGAIASEQATRVNALMDNIKRACEVGDAAAAREATRQAVEEFIVLGRAVDHASATLELPSLGWPLKGLEADLGSDTMKMKSP